MIQRWFSSLFTFQNIASMASGAGISWSLPSRGCLLNSAHRGCFVFHVACQPRWQLGTCKTMTIFNFKGWDFHRSASRTSRAEQCWISPRIHWPMYSRFHACFLRLYGMPTVSLFIGGLYNVLLDYLSGTDISLGELSVARTFHRMNCP